ncbi:nucleoporin GLE1-like [Salvia splendens]|nr:nucleoporin GLE1-like [Salvia splendens]
MVKRSISTFHAFCPSFVHDAAIRCSGLVIAIDDQILAIEGKIEANFPQSAPLFDGIDGIVLRAEALPEQIDDAVRKFPIRFPLLDWAIMLLISWITFLLSILIRLGSKSAREKEITVDLNCKSHNKSKEHTKSVQFEKPYSYADAARNHHAPPPKSVQFEEAHGEVVRLSVKRMHSWRSRIKALEEPLNAGDSPMYSSYQSANTSPVSDCSSQDENHSFNQTLGCSTYKEALEKEKEKEEDEPSTYKEALEKEKKENEPSTYKEALEKEKKENEPSTYKEALEKEKKEDETQEEPSTYKEALEKEDETQEEPSTYKEALEKEVETEEEEEEEEEEDVELKDIAVENIETN